MKNAIVLLSEMVEDINYKWEGVVEAKERDGYLFLRALEVGQYTDTEIVEDSLYGVIEDLRCDYNVDFDVEYSRGYLLVLSVIC